LDSEGVVWGMKYSRGHFNLNFDAHLEVLRNGKKKRLSESAIFLVVHFIHVDILKDFIRSRSVVFEEK
jgi:hypothetical protein